MVYPWSNETFKALLERKGRLPHALLLRGRDGIGKLACAEALARALLCERPAKDGSACGHCTGCAWMGQGSHPDFRRLEPENLAAEQGEAEQKGERKASVQISVEQVRELAGFINISSHRGGAKVVLIHPAEALNVNAANALLKNLEEPPPNCYFLLVAHRWHQLLPTLRSRCEQVVLPLPGRKEARDWLGQQKLQECGPCAGASGRGAAARAEVRRGLLGATGGIPQGDHRVPLRCAAGRGAVPRVRSGSDRRLAAEARVRSGLPPGNGERYVTTPISRPPLPPLPAGSTGSRRCGFCGIWYSCNASFHIP